MHLYDTLIIGSGYSSAGFAMARKNCIICEESQCCDTHFYLPLKSFEHTQYSPVTDLGKKLCSVFEKYRLFNGNLMCTNGFEPAFCEFLSEEDINILLKCRVVNTEKQSDGNFKVTVYTNEGLSFLYAKDVIDTTACAHTKHSYITVIYMTENGLDAENELSKVFTDGIFSKAFYENRYAMQVPVNGCDDVNEMLCRINDLWLTVNTDAKILYVAPVFFPMSTVGNGNDKKFPKDCNYSNPIAAFEAGFLFSEGGAK